MIEVVALDGGITKYDGEGSDFTVIEGHVRITEEWGDRGHIHTIAVHASGSWAIARKVTA